MLKATVRNFLINAGVAGMKKQAESRWCASRTSYACVMHALTASLLPLTIVPSLMRRLLMICSWSKTSFRPSAWRARGKGTFAQVERAVEILRGRRLPFGISCCYTSRNVEVIGSEEYFDQMIAWGAKFCWFFTYMPIGREAAPELMVSAEQRAFMYRRHINANGDYEPCAFIHYSDANVRTHTFLEAQQAPLFTACRRGQPWNENHLRPCPLLGSPDALVEAVLGPAQAEDRGGNIIYYENEQGWARFHGNGAFELETRYETEASLDELTETWLDRLGIQVDRDSETRHFEDSFRRVEYTCMYGQAELYNCNVVLLFQADGRLEVSGRWMFAEVREQEQADWLSPATVLIRLLAEFRAGGVICERIDAMEQGWLLHASASEGELLPVWQIRTDGGNYYVDCATGALITDLGQ